PRPGWAERDANACSDATVTLIARLLNQKESVSVLAIGISGQMHSSVFLDRTGTVIHPAVLWCDGRTTAECKEITRAAGGEENLRKWVLPPAIEGFTLPTILWLRNHDPPSYI